MCLNNLGRRLSVAGRAIEALDYWRRALELNPNFGMALCNRARILSNYAEALEDPNQKALFLFLAHKEASAALAPTALYTDARDERTKTLASSLKEWIESVMDVGGIAALDPLKGLDTSTTEEEREYRHWCLVNCLYLNPSNDLGPYAVAATDSVGLAAHDVPVDTPYRFASFYDQMMQEYVSARWLLYEGLTVRAPHFSDRDVLLQATEPRPSLSLAVEKIKAAYRISYSLFDKVGFFMNLSDYLTSVPQILERRCAQLP
jgi:LA2681-like HEPN